MKSYVHTQIGYALLAIYGVAIPIVGYLIRDVELNSVSQAALILLLAALLTFSTLRVNVDHRTISIQFGFGIIRKSFSVSEIETYQVVRNRWYYGLGIRYTPRGWLYCVSGLSAIELQMKNGKYYRIGPDDPTGLASAVEEALRVSAGQ